MVRRWNLVAITALILAGATSCDAVADEPAGNQSDGQDQGNVVIRLWDEAAPLAKGDDPADIPRLTLRRPEQPNGTAIVICPGGGYGTLVTSYEGKEVAEWLMGLGVTTFVLHYRVAPYQHPAPLLDVQRAIRTVRAHAKQFGVDPQRIGIIGFSAGGHVAACGATMFDRRPIPADDAIDRESARPNFAIMAYPVISMAKGVTHAGSRKNLLGPDPEPALVKKMSANLAVSKKTPPVFLFHTATDPAVPVANSILFFQACRKHDVPAALHIFDHGRHGVGLGGDDLTLKAWPSLCEDWMRRHGWLAKTDR